jgi:type IV fimbrial biogenesis protein FimT
MTKTHGFTLVELLVTLAVASILLTVGVPSMRDMIRNNQLTATTNLFVSSLNIARSEAIKQGRNANVCVSDTPVQNSCSGTDWGLGWLVWVDINQNGVLDYPAEVIRTVQPLPGSVEFTSVQNSFQIDPQGTVDNPNATLDVCDDRTAETGRQLRVMATGGISLDSQYGGCT